MTDRIIEAFDVTVQRSMQRTRKRDAMNRENDLASELKRIAGGLTILPFPTRFAVEVTAECNLACTMCHHPDMQRPKGRMPFELWKRCADQIADEAPQTQCWFSFCGDPLIEAELLLQMLEYAKSKGLQSLNINTNGMLMTPELADPILNSGADLVVFGIDGFSKEVFEKVRVKGDRDVVYSNVEFLLTARQKRNTGPDIQVQFIEMDENAHELNAVKQHWLARGATMKVRNKLSWGGRFDTPLGISQDSRIPCPWALTMMHVFWDGRVPRCPGDTEGAEGVGNAWDDSLKTLWQRLGKYQKLHLEGAYDELPETCHDCKDWMTGSAERIQPV